MKRVYFIKPVGMAGPIKIGCSYTPEWRYERSVRARCRAVPWNVLRGSLIKILGENWYHASYLDHREQLEIEIAALRTKYGNSRAAIAAARPQDAAA